MVVYSYAPIAAGKAPRASGLREYLLQSAPKNSAARATALSLLEELATEVGIAIDLPIRVTEHGKPYFWGKDAPEFNLSHSGELAAAVLGSGRVGIDVQEETKTLDVAKLSTRFFGEAEKEALQNAPRALFFEHWTKKEALGKLLGVGLAPLLGKDTDALAAEHGVHFHTTRIFTENGTYTLTVCATEPIKEA